MRCLSPVHAPSRAGGMRHVARGLGAVAPHRLRKYLHRTSCGPGAQPRHVRRWCASSSGRDRPCHRGRGPPRRLLSLHVRQPPSEGGFEDVHRLLAGRIRHAAHRCALHNGSSPLRFGPRPGRLAPGRHDHHAISPWPRSPALRGCPGRAVGSTDGACTACRQLQNFAIAYMSAPWHGAAREACTVSRCVRLRSSKAVIGNVRQACSRAGGGDDALRSASCSVARAEPDRGPRCHERGAGRSEGR